MKLCMAFVFLVMVSSISPISAAALHEYQDVAQSRAQSVTMTPNQFSSALTQELIEQAGTKNLIFSPLSIHTALSMTALGSNTTTERQMEDILSFSQVIENPVPSAIELSIANSVWIDNRYPVASDFVEQAKKIFSADVAKLDFSDTSSPTMINDWVSDATNEKIDSIIEELKPDMRMILVNAVHFLADWAVPFDANDTRKRTFHAPDGDYRTPFMHSERSMQVLNLRDATGIVLPYENERFVFAAILSKENLAIQQWVATQERSLVDILFEALEDTTSERVQLAIPKFLDRYEKKLSTTLQRIGLTEPFNPGLADFSRMHVQGVSDLFIDEVLHKTFIRVDEKGTEAAAVTAVMMRLTSMMPSGIPMVFDRPFLYAIIDRETERALFLGVMQSPEAP